MGDVLGRRWLFMDESIDKLDTDNYIIALEHLKSMTRCTTGTNTCQVIVISHHVIDGMFDAIITPPPK
jgi:hypothetical protein